MRLRVVEFLSFSRVCKSWRSLALSNRKRFMASKPPMAMLLDKNTCYLQDFEGREFKTILPLSGDRTCIRVTCGYLIFMGEKTRDFWLVNLITRHELYFPDVPIDVVRPEESRHVRAILVFSPSINGWVFVMLVRFKYKIWFSIAGKRAWNHLFSTLPLIDLHPFKGKIYILSMEDSVIGGTCMGNETRPCA
ncbi:unnamed protein product [Lactuca virosa]|uniref:F-box domain-containing protein n=1 Tax=Lactuca virosa TaxID=75947 RepID=A0AAU9MGT0_9ASTR|nr:unnamed protein product [Lactuca virosa]